MKEEGVGSIDQSMGVWGLFRECMDCILRFWIGLDRSCCLRFTQGITKFIASHSTEDSQRANHLLLLPILLIALIHLLLLWT